MRSEAVLSSVLDIGDEILAGAEVDELCGAELLQRHLTLLLTAGQGQYNKEGVLQVTCKLTYR